MVDHGKKKIRTAIFGAVFAGACAFLLGAGVPSVAQDSDVPFELVGNWTVQSFDGTEAHSEAPMSIEFEESGTITGSAGCNSMFGPLRQEAGGIRLGPLAVSRKACTPDILRLEQAFLKTVGAVKGYRTEANDQVLVLTDGGATDLIILAAGG